MQGCDRIVLFPLYPQYAAATTATVNDKAFQAMMDMRWQPALRTVPPYHDDPVYIEAIAQSIENHLAGLDWEPEIVLASYPRDSAVLLPQGGPLSLPVPEDGTAGA
jgi:ferrochelatase